MTSRDFNSFQMFWENARCQGKQISKYPYDNVMSFVFRRYPRGSVKQDVTILEVGCGAGNNLWPLAKEGLQVYGIDGSQTALAIAQEQFQEYGLMGKLFHQDFVQEYPFDNNFFDLVIDRAALSCVSLNDSRSAISHISRVLKKGGSFFFNPYSSKHSSFSLYPLSKCNFDKYITPVSGTLSGVGKICFYDEQDIQELFTCDTWRIEEMKELLIYDRLTESNVHAEWEVVAQKV